MANPLRRRNRSRPGASRAPRPSPAPRAEAPTGQPGPAPARRGLRWFPAFAHRLAALSGQGGTFALACALVLVWGASGPFFGYSDAWQFAINTSTTIVTFLMVFLIQNAQNRDTEAIQIKLDEIIRATAGAHNALLDMEQASEEELADYHRRYAQLAEYARRKLAQGLADDDIPALAGAKSSRQAAAR